MNNNIPLFDNSFKSFKERRLLKIKIKKLTNKYISSNCDKYLMKMRDLKLDELNNSNYIRNMVKQSINFHFGKINSNSIENNINQISNLSEFDLNCNILGNALKKELSINELQAIKNDKIYYILDKKIRNNINILKEKSLTKRINEEENENNKFTFLNDKFENKIKKIKLRNNFNNNSYNIKNKIKKINSLIKQGISNIKKKEKKNSFIKEKRKNIVNILKKNATKEINNLIKSDSLFNNQLFNIFNINPKNNKNLIEEYSYYNINRKKYLNCSEKIVLHSNILRNRKKIKKMPLFSQKNSKEKNIGKYIKSKSLDIREKENLKNSLNKIKLKKNLLSHKYLSLSNKRIIGSPKEKKIKDSSFDENDEKIALILLTNKIKNIYEKKKIQNDPIKSKTLSKIYHVYKL